MTSNKWFESRRIYIFHTWIVYLDILCTLYKLFIYSLGIYYNILFKIIRLTIYY